MDNKIFEDGRYTVWAENINKLKPGDVIYLTTSAFMYDCMCGCFMDDIRGSATVEVEILNEDLSEYDESKCRTGGCYAFAAAKVLRIVDELGGYVFDDEDTRSDVQSTLI